MQRKLSVFTGDIALNKKPILEKSFKGSQI
jgi:hypothetical protein